MTRKKTLNPKRLTVTISCGTQKVTRKVPALRAGQVFEDLIAQLECSYCGGDVACCPPECHAELGGWEYCECPLCKEMKDANDASYNSGS